MNQGPSHPGLHPQPLFQFFILRQVLDKLPTLWFFCLALPKCRDYRCTDLTHLWCLKVKCFGLHYLCYFSFTLLSPKYLGMYCLYLISMRIISLFYGNYSLVKVNKNCFLRCPFCHLFVFCLSSKLEVFFFIGTLFFSICAYTFYFLKLVLLTNDRLLLVSVSNSI